jgi:hypothetical protein
VPAEQGRSRQRLGLTRPQQRLQEAEECASVACLSLASDMSLAGHSLPGGDVGGACTVAYWLLVKYGAACIRRVCAALFGVCAVLGAAWGGACLCTAGPRLLPRGRGPCSLRFTLHQLRA